MTGARAAVRIRLGSSRSIFFVVFTVGGPGWRTGQGPPTPRAMGLVPSLIPELLIVAGMIYDWRTRGRPHPAWIIGAVVITLVVVLRGMVADTSVWLATADFLAGFNG